MVFSQKVCDKMRVAHLAARLEERREARPVKLEAVGVVAFQLLGENVELVCADLVDGKVQRASEPVVDVSGAPVFRVFAPELVVHEVILVIDIVEVVHAA